MTAADLFTSSSQKFTDRLMSYNRLLPQHDSSSFRFHQRNGIRLCRDISNGYAPGNSRILCLHREEPWNPTSVTAAVAASGDSATLCTKGA
jgi:hypothetical protein